MILAFVLALLTQPIDWCTLPGNRCPPCEGEICNDLEELKFCCYYGGGCTLVEYITLCDLESQYAVICDWGQMMPDGTIECYDQ